MSNRGLILIVLFAIVVILAGTYHNQYQANRPVVKVDANTYPYEKLEGKTIERMTSEDALKDILTLEFTDGTSVTFEANKYNLTITEND